MMRVVLPFLLMWYTHEEAAECGQPVQSSALLQKKSTMLKVGAVLVSGEDESIAKGLSATDGKPGGKPAKVGKPGAGAGEDGPLEPPAAAPQEANECLQGVAYHSGGMVDDNAPAANEEECNNQCTLRSECLYWDWSGNHCRLRDGMGEAGMQSDAGSVGGQRGCVLQTPECAIRFAQDLVAGTPSSNGSGQPTDSDSACRTLCTQESACAAWARQPTTGTCWLTSTTEVSFEPDDDRNGGMRCNTDMPQ